MTAPAARGRGDDQVRDAERGEPRDESATAFFVGGERDPGPRLTERRRDLLVGEEVGDPDRSGAQALDGKVRHGPETARHAEDRHPLPIADVQALAAVGGDADHLAVEAPVRRLHPLRPVPEGEDGGPGVLAHAEVVELGDGIGDGVQGTRLVIAGFTRRHVEEHVVFPQGRSFPQSERTRGSSMS